MIPPRSNPPGVLQLVETSKEGKHTLIREVDASPGRRTRLQNEMHDLLMLNPTKTYTIIENHAVNLLGD